MNRSGASRRDAGTPLSERVCAWACAGFALWTLVCHAAVAAGASLIVALAGVALAAVAAGSVRWRLGRREGSSEPWTAAAPQTEAPGMRLRGAGALLAVLAVAAGLGSGSAVALWGCGVVLLAAAAVPCLLGQPPSAIGPARGARLEAGLWTLAAACAVGTLLTHRPDLDDAFYVNLAVAAADEPGRALLSRDTLHGIEGLPLHLPVYRLHSYELWNGAIAWATGIPAIRVFHWISASLGAVLVPLAHAALFRRLTPRHWLWTTACLVVVLFAAGETHRWYGNLAFVRMWQGKAFALFVFVPLVYSYALRFAQRPGVAGFALLAAAQIAAVGCSSSAVWIAPAAALGALCAAARPGRAGLSAVALGSLASLYLLAAGWWIRADVAVQVGLPAPAGPGTGLAAAAREVLGGGRLAVFSVLAVLGAWTCSSGMARRFAVAVPLSVLAVVLDPYAVDWVRGHLTGPSYWRAWWALPVPILISLVLVAPLELRGGRAGRVACVALAALFAVWVPAYSALSRENGGPDAPLRVGRPRLKVPEESYRWAAALVDRAPAGARVVAPYWISRWVPTFHGHPFPLEVRPEYLRSHRARLSAGEIEDRHVMTAYAGGTELTPDAARRFREGLVRYDVRAVCLASSEHLERAREILREAGFRLALRGTGHEIWVRA